MVPVASKGRLHPQDLRERNGNDGRHKHTPGAEATPLHPAKRIQRSFAATRPMICPEPVGLGSTRAAPSLKSRPRCDIQCRRQRCSSEFTSRERPNLEQRVIAHHPRDPPSIKLPRGWSPRHTPQTCLTRGQIKGTASKTRPRRWSRGGRGKLASLQPDLSTPSVALAGSFHQA